MVTTMTIVMIVMIVIDPKKAIDAPRMIEIGIVIPSGRKRSTPKTKRFLKRRNVKVVVIARRTKNTLRIAVMD